MDISELLALKRKYKNLKNNIVAIINKLNSAIENLEIPTNEISKIYNIDSISIDEGKFNNIKDSIISKKNYLKNTVLPGINREIVKIENEIESVG